MNLNFSRPCCPRQATPEVPEFTWDVLFPSVLQWLCQLRHMADLETFLLSLRPPGRRPHYYFPPCLTVTVVYSFNIPTTLWDRFLVTYIWEWPRAQGLSVRWPAPVFTP